MEMTSCHICGKIFGTSGGSVCPACRKLLDIVYEKARNYLRDNPKAELHAKSLAEAIDEDVRLIEMLVIEGRFDDKDSPRMEESELDKRRKKLLEDLQKNINKPIRKDPTSTTYGSDRHGRG